MTSYGPVTLVAPGAQTGNSGCGVDAEAGSRDAPVASVPTVSRAVDDGAAVHRATGVACRASVQQGRRAA